VAIGKSESWFLERIRATGSAAGKEGSRG